MTADPIPHSAAIAADAGGQLPLGTEARRALLHECFAQYRGRLFEVVKASVDDTNDLFETHSHIPDGAVEAFRSKRGEWLALFDQSLRAMFERRVVEGALRKGRRPDADASLATLRVLTAFDHDRQTALKNATHALHQYARKELAALDLRVEALMGDPGPRDLDNPFAVSYILDAIGASARATYPNPRVWRPFMDRVLSDITPEVNKIYISLNRFLADRGVLPEIKAALRARSEFRPHDDRDLLPTFSRMLSDAPPVPRDIAVPELAPDPGAPPSLVFAEKTAVAAHPGASGAGEMSATRILAGLAALASSGTLQHVATAGVAPQIAGTAATPGVETPVTVPVGAAPMFPSLDPLMALGASTALFATLANWQRLDLPTAIAQAVPAAQERAGESTVVPLNLIPHIRAAIEGQISNDTDRITMDVIALLFDYVFRDKSIPDSMRSLFGRLQVPILKAALLDRTFFSDRAHPARQLLDNLADAAVGTEHDAAYRDAFVALSAGVVEEICRDFEIDVEVFRLANTKLAAFIDGERQRADQATSEDVAAALRAESSEADRSQVRAFLRDRLAGLDLPFEVRGFVETAFADHLATLHRDQGTDSEAWNDAVRTLDDLLWSIVAKERTSQKARLTKMIPKLIGALRRACTAVALAPERARGFFEALYQLHIAAIKPAATDATPAPGITATETVATATEAPPIANVHDFVSEMVVGTWLAFTKEDQPVNARLSWVSPLRTKYLFTSRSRTRAFVYTPEELAYEIAGGQVSLVLEPVPLFDRAVSSALDTLAARRPAASASEPESVYGAPTLRPTVQ
ncbi:MAG: DUF1631 family protein [Burkholderiales bacterium]|nr:DUF1631 family protein [Burkholderiales bacterium]